MFQQRGSFLSNIPLVVKNLLIINILLYLATTMIDGIDLYDLLGLHHWKSEKFFPHQFVTHMFMHGGITHLLFNMFGLWMFGAVLENVWGSKRFLIFYMIAGLGAALIQMIAQTIHLNVILPDPDPQLMEMLLTEGRNLLDTNRNYVDPVLGKANLILNMGMVGASGAIYGVLVAFGMLFPNTKLMLIFLPVPIKAKYFIPILVGIDLFLGIGDFSWDPVAHFAHLGGALFGFIIVKYWNKNSDNFY